MVSAKRATVPSVCQYASYGGRRTKPPLWAGIFTIPSITPTRAVDEVFGKDRLLSVRTGRIQNAVRIVVGADEFLPLTIRAGNFIASFLRV
jgi:hypothetical protein